MKLQFHFVLLHHVSYVCFKVTPSELKGAVASLVQTQCPFLGALSAREREIVAFMNLVHPLPSSGNCFEEVLDVSGPQAKRLPCLESRKRSVGFHVACRENRTLWE